MEWQASILKGFLVFFILNSCQGCTRNNLNTLEDSVVFSLLDAVKEYIPKFDASTVPNIDSIVAEFKAGSNNEDMHLNITQLLKKHGYGAEQHQVKSEDGYELNFFRIPGNGSVVFLMHGLVCSSDDYVSAGPDVALAYLLADLGYDVWLGNARGTFHSRQHVSLSPDCAEFWDFSWDEIGRYDLPAMIDYILKKTNEDKLAYIGHSQGTTVFFVMASERPEYNDKISIMIALSAIAFQSNTKNPLFRLSASSSTEFTSEVIQALGGSEVMPHNQLERALAAIACDTPDTADVFCDNFMFMLFGPDYFQINATMLPVVFGHFPGGSAVNQFLHYGQLILSGRFARFDYGVEKNIENYKAIIPPDYPLQNITSKVAIFYSDNDWESTPLDLERLVAQLPNVIEKYRVPFPSFAHMDFLYGKDVRSLVYNKVVELLKHNV